MNGEGVGADLALVWCRRPLLSTAAAVGAAVAGSRCPWGAVAGALSSAPPALQSLPPCGSARWFSDPGRLFQRPSCAEEQKKYRTTMTSNLNQTRISTIMFQVISEINLCGKIHLTLKYLNV